jgi:hypothetical protein
MGQNRAIRQDLGDFQLVAKARQAAKLAEIRETLIAAGCDTVAKQASVLGVSRGTAWVLLNRDKRAGPSSKIIKRILSSPHLSLTARRKVEEYVEEKIAGLYGHRKERTRWFRDQFPELADKVCRYPSQPETTNAPSERHTMVRSQTANY